eukprot:jgi/Ulvmu1/2776/UM140_0005.1
MRRASHLVLKPHRFAAARQIRAMAASLQEVQEAEEPGSRKPIQICGWKIDGVSVAGQETCIILPQLSLAFDIGRCPNRSVPQQHVFVTHGHMDHIGGIPFHAATRALMGMPPTQLYSMPKICDAAQGLLAIHDSLQGDTIPIDVHPLTVGDQVEVKKGFIIRPFRTVHAIPSQGYLIYRRNKKLRAEFQGAGREAIIAAKKSGIDINDTREEPEIAFTGDTQIEFADLPENSPVFQAKLLIMECTFVDDTVSVEKAKDNGHTHIQDLVKYADKFQNERILLIHFSARHSPTVIQQQLDDLLPARLRERVVPFLSGFSLL